MNVETAQRDPWVWFEELVRDNPSAESYRAVFNMHRADVAGMYQALQAETKRADDAEAFMPEKLKRFLVESMTQAWDKAATYTTAVLSIGYVGLFATWSQTASSISAPHSRVVAIFALLSLASFILFEIFKMGFGHVLLLRTIKTAQAEGANFDPELSVYLQRTSSGQKWFYCAWFASMGVSVVFGLAGASVLVYAHLEKLFAPAL